MEQMINSGKKSQIMKLQALALKAGYNEEAELDEGPVKSREKTVNMVHKTSGKEVVIVATAKNIKDQEKLGFRTQDNPKDVMKAIKANDKLGIGEQVAEQLSKIRGNTPLKEDENEAYELGTNEYREYIEKLTPGETKEVDETSATTRPMSMKVSQSVKKGHVPKGMYGKAAKDARRAMSKDRDLGPRGRGDDADDTASDADVKAASKNILAQMRKAVSLGGRFDVEFLDKKKVRVKPAIANAFVKKYEGMRRPADKEKFQNQAMKSYKDLLKVLKAGYNEEAELDEKVIEHIFGVEFQVDAPEEKPIRTGKEPHVKTIDKLTKKHKLITDHADDLSKFNIKDEVGGKNVMKFFKDMERSGLEVIKKRITDNAKLTSFGEETELDEALPSHLKKHFDKDGNPKSKEGKAAWERLATSKGYRKYTSQQIKMAIGVAFDKRYVQGNMTGAAKTIEKIAKGLSEIEPVANALRRANENTILDRIDRKLKERKNG